MRQLILASHRSGLDPFHRYNGNMVGRECYHCKHWVEEGEEHDCWTTTETALTQDLSGALPDAWERLRETAVSFGDQRIYASHKSVMFSRKSRVASKSCWGLANAGTHTCEDSWCKGRVPFSNRKQSNLRV